MPSFSKSSLDKLNTCDQQLIDLFKEVIKHYDCTVVCGVRSKEDQDEAVRTGKSKTPWPTSKHNVLKPDQKSRAVDVVPCPINWNNREAFYHFGGFVKAIAMQKGIKIRWGGDWDSDNDLKDQNFIDLPHFELVD